MTSRRFLRLAFAAALTAATSSAATIQFTLYISSGNPNQTVTLSVDESVYGPSSATIATAALEYTDGWHSIAIDYTNTRGPSYLDLQVNQVGVDKSYLASYAATGVTISGLQAAYYALDDTTHQPTTLLSTDYGEGPIYFTGTSAPWNTLNLPSAFEEKLSGYIYLGAGTPLLSGVPASQQVTLPSDPPPSDPPPADGGGDAPEPPGWWLAAAALPLMLFSRLRLKRARACH